MYRIGDMELVGLSKDEGVLISWNPEGLGIELSQAKLASVKKQYEAEMEALRQQLEVQQERSDHVDHQLRQQYLEAMSSLREAMEDSGQQKELDAVVGQLQEIHQRQMHQLNAQHLQDTAMQVTAMRLTVEQVQSSRLKLLEEEHQATVQQLSKQHKDQINALQAKLGNGDADCVFPLSANEELTQQYQNLVQRINSTLEKDVLEHLHGSENDSQEIEGGEPKTNGFPPDTISRQQAEAIQQTLQTQQAEVLSLRSRLLQEYEGMLQQRSEGMSQQTDEVQRLQREMEELQQQYERQIAEFQDRIRQQNEEEAQRSAERQQREQELEEMKAKYERQIADMEQTFSSQITALQQTVTPAPGPIQDSRDITDGGDSGPVQYSASEAETGYESLSLRLTEERDYVHKTATLTAISDVESDTADSPRSAAGANPGSSQTTTRLQDVQSSLDEKTSRLAELEKSLEEEREKVSDLASKLDTSSQALADLQSQLAEKTGACEALQRAVEERDLQLAQAQEDRAESEKLLKELTEKETKTAKEREELAQQLKTMEDVVTSEGALLTSTPTVEEELKQLRASLEESASQLKAAEGRQQELQDRLSEAEHQHHEALDELRQELEHEAQMERETLQSEFRVQLDVELKRQASELQQRMSGNQTGKEVDSGVKALPVDSDVQESDPWVVKSPSETVSVSDRTAGDEDVCVPDAPHSEETVVQAALAASRSVPVPSLDSPQGNLTSDSDVDRTCEQEALTAPGSDTSREEELTQQTSPPVSSGVPVSSSSSSPPLSGATTTADVPSRSQPAAESVLETDTDRQLAELCRQFEAEKTQLVASHQQRVSELEALLSEAEEKYNNLKEDIEESEGKGLETLMKDRYDMELELAKNLMQQEFDDNLQMEKKKFVERHRMLMDDFMADRETEAEEIKRKHELELEELRSTLSTQYDGQITGLLSELQQFKDTASTMKETSGDSEKSAEVEELRKELQDAKDRWDALKAEHAEAVASLKELEDVKNQLEEAKTQHAQALAALKDEHENNVSELKYRHQEELEAAALDTDVVKSDLEQAHQAEVKRLQDLLDQQRQAQTPEKETPADDKSAPKERVAIKHGGRELAQSSPGPEAMHAISEISLPLHITFKDLRQRSLDGEMTPEIRSSLEYEETDEEGSVHSFSSLTATKPRSFADVVKGTPPLSSSPPSSSTQQEQRVKQLEGQIERLTQQLAQQTPQARETMLATSVNAATSPPPTLDDGGDATPVPSPAAAVSTTEQADPMSTHNLLTMLQSDLDRISTERDAVQQTNNRLLQLLSDSVHTYVEVEDTINRRLHTVVAATSSHSPLTPHTPLHSHRSDGHPEFVTPRGAGLASFTGPGGEHGAVGGAGVGVSSPQSDHSFRRHDDPSSPTLEETSILSSATDEGLDMSQRLTESIFTGPDIDAEGEEIVSDARGRLQNAVSRLLEMIERTTQQLLDAKATQADLLETMSNRTRDYDDLAARMHDLEEQVRQEVTAKEYLGLELHKAEGLISGYSSERESMEEQLHSLEEQKEVLASDLEATRRRLQEFQDATHELEARRQDVEQQQMILQENAGQETQESAMAGGDATVSQQKALLTEMTSLKQETREHALQLQHRLAQAERHLQERETSAEETEKEHQRQVEELRRRVDDLGLQLENTERQLKSSKQFVDEQLTEREQEREEYQKEVDKLKSQLQSKEKQTGSQTRLQREIQDLTEQLQARIESQSLMHRQTQDLQHNLQERELSAQELRVWIDTLEQELDQRGDTEEQLKGRIQNLERRLTVGEVDSLSDQSASPELTPRPESPSSLPMSPTRPAIQRRQSRISLEDELRRSRQAEEDLSHEREALQKRVQEQLLQISALRNQLDEMRHWAGPSDPSTGSTSTADLREQLDSERETLEQKEEELLKVKADQESLEKELGEKRREVDQLRQQITESTAATERIKQLEEERNTLQNRITELSEAGTFPPELLDEKNAEIEELQQQLVRTETELHDKEELVSDLQDTVLSLQQGEACLDVSLPFNQPIPLNASFTERLQDEERPSSVTSLAQELDQTVGEREAQIEELTTQVDELTEQLSAQREQLEQLRTEKAALQSDLQQRDEDFNQLQEEKSEKQEQLVEKESRMQQLAQQVDGLHTEITSLTAFQVELQKDFDTVQSMLDEKEREIESLTKELLETRSQADESDVSELEAELAAVQRQLREQRNVVDEKEEELYELSEKLEAMDTLKSEMDQLKSKLAETEKDRDANTQLQQEVSEKLEKERRLRSELQQELEEFQRAARAGRGRAHSFPSLNVKPMEDQVKELKAEVFHLEGVVKEKEELISYLEEEKAADSCQREKDLADVQQQLTAALEQAASLEKEKQQQLKDGEDMQQEVREHQEASVRLEAELLSVRQQVEQDTSTIASLRAEVACLKEELDQAKSQSVATDDAKALQERLQQSGDRIVDLEQQVTDVQTRLDQTAVQLTEREEQIQQLQAEVQTLQQEAGQRGESGGEESEGEEQLRDALSRAQRLQTVASSSLSSSLPIPAGGESPAMARWDSEPGLSSGHITEITQQAQEAHSWMRRQQRELAAQNRELAAVRNELEAWVRRKDGHSNSNQHSASIMIMTLRLQEKEALVTSLKRELRETKQLLASAEASMAEVRGAERPLGGQQPLSAQMQHPLSAQMQHQITHLRSELHRARAALAAMQEHSGLDNEGSEVGEGSDFGEGSEIEQLEAELNLLKASSAASSPTAFARDFSKKMQELREELAAEHQRQMAEAEEEARRDLEAKLTDLQSRHDLEVTQLQQLHQRKLDQALMQQQQELEKHHKTELNSLRVQHQQEIDRLRSAELASQPDVSVAENLHVDISVTQQMDERMLGVLTADDDGSDAGSVGTATSSASCPPRIQALLDRLREAGEHILSVSELDLLQRHLSPGGGDPHTEALLREAMEGEKLALTKTIHALKELLGQADRVTDGLEEGVPDWRAELIHCLVEVYRQERLGLEAELHTLRLQLPGQDHATTIRNLDNRLQEQERLHQSGLDAMLRAERQSLLAEMEDLQSRLSQQRQEQNNLQSTMAESLAQQEETASTKAWKLQREVQVLEYKLQQEKVIGEDLRKTLDGERQRLARLSSELSQDKGSLISTQSELQSTQLQLSRTRDALEREQNRFTSVTDALEEEREKNNHLADKLEALRRQQNTFESDIGRSEAVRRERENADSRFIKELQAELSSEREQLHKAVEVAEEERRQRQQMQAAADRERQQMEAVKQELEKLRRHSKKVKDTESAKLADVQKLVEQEQEQIRELQVMLADRDATIRQQGHQIQQLLDEVQQLQSTSSSLGQELGLERQKAESLVALMDNERQQQQALQDQEQAAVRELRHELSQAKVDTGESRRQLEQEKSRSDSLRLELERAQSELRALTQHAGATERQLETEHSTTYTRLRAAQRERDDLQVKVHELEMELDRLQDRLQDLELELDRSRQRELEARHDVERHKLYPSASPRSNPNTPRTGVDSQLQSRLNAFCQQVHSVAQRLQTLTTKQRDHNDSLASGEGNTDKRSAVEALMAELKTLQTKMAAGEQIEAVSGQEKARLEGCVAQLKKEKEELQHRLSLLEDENNQRTPRLQQTANTSNNHLREGMPQYVSDSTTSDDEYVYERTIWASERLNLQMALDSAEHEIDRLKKELRSFRGRFNSEGFMVEADRDKMQRLYGKYLRAESFRKALVYQKKYLLLLLGGYQDSEQQTLAIIATMGGQPSSTLDLTNRRRHRRLFTIFRSTARMVVAVFRMKYLVRKWKRAMRVGSPVVAGRVNQQYGYVASPSSFTAPNTGDMANTSHTAAYVHTLSHPNGSQSLPPYTAGAAAQRFYTPPTKDHSHQAHKAALSPASSAARRQLMGELERSLQSSSPGEDTLSTMGAAAHAGSSHDDFIQRLENLQSRLSQNGEPTQHRPAWR